MHKAWCDISIETNVLKALLNTELIKYTYSNTHSNRVCVLGWWFWFYSFKSVCLQ